MRWSWLGNEGKSERGSNKGSEEKSASVPVRY